MEKKLNVLVVDDQPGVRQLLSIIVKEAGHTVREAENGKKAVEVATSWKPDLVIMDVRMPVMGGVQALEKIKLLYPDLPVIMMTAYGSDDVMEELHRKGAAMCLGKPFDVDYIMELLVRFGNKKKNDQEDIAVMYN